MTFATDPPDSTEPIAVPRGGYDRALDGVWEHAPTLKPRQQMSLRTILWTCVVGLAFWSVIAVAVVFAERWVLRFAMTQGWLT